MEINEYFYEVRRIFDTELRNLPHHKDSICPEWTKEDLEQIKHKVILEITKKNQSSENAEKIFYNSIYLW